jgi:hypothetical protein
MTGLNINNWKGKKVNYHEKFDNLIFTMKQGMANIVSELQVAKAQAAEKPETDYIRNLGNGQWVDLRSIISITELEDDGYGSYKIYIMTAIVPLHIRWEGKCQPISPFAIRNGYKQLLEDWKNYRNSL